MERILSVYLSVLSIYIELLLFIHPFIIIGIILGIIIFIIIKKVSTYRVTDYFIIHKKSNKIYQSITIKTSIKQLKAIKKEKNPIRVLGKIFEREAMVCYDKLEYNKEYIISTHFTSIIRRAKRMKKIVVISETIPIKYLKKNKPNEKRFVWEMMFYNTFTNVYKILIDTEKKKKYTKFYMDYKFIKIENR